MSYGKTPQQVVDFYKEAIRRIDALPGVSKTAFGNVVPWRDGGCVPGLQLSADGHVHAAGVEDPRPQWRVISPGFFAALGVPIIADLLTRNPIWRSPRCISRMSRKLPQDSD
jgi:hypothetical protein